MSQRINVTTESERSRNNPPGYGRPPFIMRIPWWVGVLLALLLATLCLPVAAVLLVVVGLLALLVSLLFRRRRPYVVRTQRTEVLHIDVQQDRDAPPEPPRD